MTVGQSKDYNMLLLESVDVLKYIYIRLFFIINMPELNNWYIKLPHGHVSMLK